MRPSGAVYSINILRFFISRRSHLVTSSSQLRRKQYVFLVSIKYPQLSSTVGPILDDHNPVFQSNILKLFRQQLPIPTDSVRRRIHPHKLYNDIHEWVSFGCRMSEYRCGGHGAGDCRFSQPFQIWVLIQLILSAEASVSEWLGANWLSSNCRLFLQ